MSNDDITEIANKWINYFNQRDLEKLLDLYDGEAEHFSPKLRDRRPETMGLIKGKSSLRKWWQDSFDRLPTLEYKLVRLTPFENRIFIEYTRHVDGEENLYVGEMFEIDNNSKIMTSMVFHR